jgi:hypothetical protein
MIATLVRHAKKLRNPMTRQTLIDIILVIVSVILAVMVGVKQNTINDLQETILQTKNMPPKTVTITENEVKYSYRDSTIIKVKHAPEAKVVVNTERYEQLYSIIDSLQNKLSDAVNITTYAVNDTTNKSGSDSNAIGIQALQKEIDVYINMLKSPLANNLISIQQYGLCIRPIAGIVWDSEVSPMVGTKVIFFHEYGLSVVSTPHIGGFAVSRYLNDVVPFLHNTQGTIGIGLPYKKSEGGNLFAGLIVNL